MIAFSIPELFLPMLESLMKLRRGFAVIAAALTFLAVKASAFCSQPRLRIDDEFFQSDIVATATIIADEYVGSTEAEPDGGHRFTWKLLRTFRGRLMPGQTVVTFSGSNSAHFPWSAEQGLNVGRRYLVFILHTKDAMQSFVDNCGNSIELAKATHTIQVIESLPARHSLVYGEVAMYPDARVKGSSDMDCTQINLLLHSASGVQRVPINGDCKFSKRVNPGSYSAVMRYRGHLIPGEWTTYRNHLCFTVPRGGSAGLAFRWEEGFPESDAPLEGTENQLNADCNKRSTEPSQR